MPPVEIGEVMRAAGIGRVMESRHEDFAEGDEVYGVFGVQCYAVSDGRGVTPVDTTLATHRVAGSNPVPATPRYSPKRSRDRSWGRFRAAIPTVADKESRCIS